DEIVARPVRHGEMCVIQHMNEARLASARRDIAEPVPAGCADAEKGRKANESARVRVEGGQDLAACLTRILVNPAQPLLGFQLIGHLASPSHFICETLSSLRKGA